MINELITSECTSIHISIINQPNKFILSFYFYIYVAIYLVKYLKIYIVPPPGDKELYLVTRVNSFI